MPDAQDNGLRSLQRLVGVSVAMSAAALALSVWAVIATRDHVPPPPPPASAPIASPNAAPAPPVAADHTPSLAPVGRSPLPQPGESIVKPFAVQSVAPPASPTSASPPPPAGQAVPWHQAARYVGQTVAVEGKVLATFNTGNVCFLNFTTEPRGGDKFYLIVFKDLFNAWPQPPEKYFLDKTVRATGRIDLHQGRPQIKVNNKSQIAVVE